MCTDVCTDLLGLDLVYKLKAESLGMLMNNEHGADIGKALRVLRMVRL